MSNPYYDEAYDSGVESEREDIVWWIRHDPDVKRLIGIREAQVLSELLEEGKHNE